MSNNIARKRQRSPDGGTIGTLLLPPSSSSYHILATNVAGEVLMELEGDKHVWAAYCDSLSSQREVPQALKSIAVRQLRATEESVAKIRAIARQEQHCSGEQQCQSLHKRPRLSSSFSTTKTTGRTTGRRRHSSSSSLAVGVTTSGVAATEAPSTADEKDDRYDDRYEEDLDELFDGTSASCSLRDHQTRSDISSNSIWEAESQDGALGEALDGALDEASNEAPNSNCLEDCAFTQGLLRLAARSSAAGRAATRTTLSRVPPDEAAEKVKKTRSKEEPADEVIDLNSEGEEEKKDQINEDSDSDQDHSLRLSSRYRMNSATSLVTAATTTSSKRAADFSPLTTDNKKDPRDPRDPRDDLLVSDSGSSSKSSRTSLLRRARQCVSSLVHSLLKGVQ